MQPTLLPPQFVNRMRTLLGDEADAFFASYERSPVSGLRVNTLRSSPEAFAAISPWPLTPIPWTRDAFSVSDDARPGRHPFHAAGLYYLQEPSAMAAVEALEIRPGQTVLDLAAAPGGKATQIASHLGGRGVLVANEMVGNRIKPLGENLERWGTTRAVLTNEDPAHLAEAFGPVFDRVLLDAPCSGEGMFRKSPIAVREWSPEHVAGSAARQSKILRDAAKLVKPGGLLLYSTCTFAVEENEGQIDRFLAEHPDWDLREIPFRPGFAYGRPEWARSERPLERTVRLWPHLINGEGHFLALLQHCGSPVAVEGPVETESARHRNRTRSSDDGLTSAVSSFQAFLGETVPNPPDWLLATDAIMDGLRLRGETLFLAVDELTLPADIRVVRPGLALGSAKPGRFEPSHALALALTSDAVTLTIDLSVADAERFLAGETLDLAGAPGWVLVTVAGYPLGWGKRSNGIVKNHYPKGLRRPFK